MFLFWSYIQQLQIPNSTSDLTHSNNLQILIQQFIPRNVESVLVERRIGVVGMLNRCRQNVEIVESGRAMAAAPGGGMGQAGGGAGGGAGLWRGQWWGRPAVVSAWAVVVIVCTTLNHWKIGGFCPTGR